MLDANPFGRQRDALLRDLNGNDGALRALEELVVAFPDQFARELLDVDADRNKRARRQRVRKALAVLRTEVRNDAANLASMGYVDETAAQTRAAFEHLSSFTPEPGLGGRPPTLDEWARARLAEETVVRLRRCGLNLRPSARGGPLERVLERVYSAVGVEGVDYTDRLQRRAAKYGDVYADSVRPWREGERVRMRVIATRGPRSRHSLSEIEAARRVWQARLRDSSDKKNR
jgi:hypothetical protein